MRFKTFTPSLQAGSAKKWYLVNAEGKTLGHLATQIADLLRGKNKAVYDPHRDMGDYVVVINAEKIHVSGKKEEDKEYFSHSGYWGHLRRKSLGTVRQKNPTRLLEDAVSGMLHRNRLKKFIVRKLKIYAGTEHPHVGQKLINL